MIIMPLAYPFNFFIGPPDKLENEHLKTLKTELAKKYAIKELDGFCIYL